MKKNAGSFCMCSFLKITSDIFFFKCLHQIFALMANFKLDLPRRSTINIPYFALCRYLIIAFYSMIPINYSPVRLGISAVRTRILPVYSALWQLQKTFQQHVKQCVAKAAAERPQKPHMQQRCRIGPPTQVSWQGMQDRAGRAEWRWKGVATEVGFGG